MKVVTSVSMWVLAIAVLAIAMVAAPAFAQSEAQPQPPRTPTVEVSPFLAMGSPTSSRVGTAIIFPVTSDFGVEVELGYRKGEGDINALSSNVSMLYALPRIGRVFPYVAAGVGLEEYGAPVSLPERGEIFTQSKLAFAVNAGGGIKVPVDDNWSLRSDARWFKSFGRNGSEHWRLYQGASFGVGKRGESTRGN